MALNWGNEGNREALINSVKGGKRIYTREQIETYLNALDKKDWEFVQSVWNYIAKYRPMMGKVHHRIHGVTPKWVEPDPVYTKHGVFKGGYYPIKFDPGSSFKVTEEELNDLMKQSDFGRFTKAHTKDGFTKERVGSGGRPVLLDMSVLHSHVHNVIRYVTLAEPVMEAQKVLQSEEVKTAMEATNNMDSLSALDVWLKDTASGEMVSSDILSKLLRRLRTGYTVSKLGWNVGTMLLQPLGIISSMPMVGYGNILKAAVTVFTKPLGKTGMFAMAMDKSNFLKERSSTFNKDIWDIVKAMDENPGTGSRIPDVVKKSMFGGIAFMQRFADTTVWFAEYNKGVKAGLSEKDAVYQADRMVAKTQASGVFSDRTPIERGSASATQRQSEFVRIWTALGSYFFAKANMLAEITGRTDFKNPVQVAKYFTDFAMMFVVETLIVSALRGSWPEDEEEIPAHVLKETSLSIMSVFPGLREVGSSIQGFTGGSAYASVASEASRLTKAITDIPEDGLDKQFWKSLNNVGGVIFKYPSSAINRFGDALYRDIEGEDVSPEEYFIYREKD